MAAPGARGLLWPLGCALLLLGCWSAASPAHGRRLICWHAIMNCHGEERCKYAYEQYLGACSSILNGHRKKCPSHCISSLVQLNATQNGPALEDCSCASDARCLETKRAIEPCLPRTTNMGCTEARRQCERDPQCRHAMTDYLDHCGKLFSGASCTHACRDVIAQMRRIPVAQRLDTCVCDGAERAICEFVKVSMRNLCFGAPPPDDDDDVDDEGSGGAGGGWADWDDDEDAARRPEGRARESGGSGALRPGPASALALLLLLAFL
ncbi:growth arrest-specific protein 1a [Denticeps clupeoides]|uniref:GDNF/GAS1 domain-containing protein n=1 Tax=Denticeps clupeoides TaxID=299321 RepID=A0AAY4DZD6_9TELE|nr:growth arrest-specific protein 1-like [Denticeps clupeoides]